MEEQKRKIIEHEIRFWKESRLLPEQYCDYLLAFYADHDRENEQRKKGSLSFFLLLGPFFVSALFVNYFTEISPLMQILFFVFGLGICVIVKFRKKRKAPFAAAMAVSCIIFLLWTAEIWKWSGSDILFLYMALMVNCSGWIIIGKWTEQLYFKAAGILGLIIVTFFFVKSFF